MKVFPLTGVLLGVSFELMNGMEIFSENLPKITTYQCTIMLVFLSISMLKILDDSYGRSPQKGRCERYATNFDPFKLLRSISP